MPLRKRKPTSPGRRFQTVSDFSDITKTKPEKSLLAPKPHSGARIALLHYHDGEKRYILAPSRVKVGDLLRSGQGAEIRPGNALPLRYIPVGSTVHNVELKPGGGGKMARGAGMSIQLVAKEGDYATLRLPSTE